MQDQFDEVSERVGEQGLRVIDLGDAAMAERYGLRDLVTERGA